jgi:hypothetical protein
MELHPMSYGNMASTNDIKTYLAYWLQLGRGLWMPGHADRVRPATILGDGAYSADFEALWVQIQAPDVVAQSYLEGTDQTIGELLSPSWEINPCARCGLPIPFKTAGLSQADAGCPCADMSHQPDLSLIPPRAPISTQAVLGNICARLRPDRVTETAYSPAI